VHGLADRGARHAYSGPDRVSLAVPNRYLEIRGDAEISPDDDYAFADRLGAKYNANLRDQDRPGESRVKVIIRPVRVNAIDMRT